MASRMSNVADNELFGHYHRVISDLTVTGRPYWLCYAVDSKGETAFRGGRFVFVSECFATESECRAELERRGLPLLFPTAYAEQVSA